MKKIYIASSWNKQDITKSWSGTSYQVYKEFCKLRNVELLDAPVDIPFRAIGIVNRTLCSWSLRMMQYYYSNWVLKRQIRDNNIPILSVGTIRNFDNPTYIYVDNLYCASRFTNEYVKEGWGYNPWAWLTDENLTKAIEFEHNILRQAKGIFCMGGYLTDIAKDIYKDCANKIYTAYGGINVVSEITSSEAKVKNTILFVGRDFYRKAGDLVVEAIKISRAKYNKDIKLLLVGPHEYPLTEKYDWLTYYGDIPYSEVSKLMSNVSLYCMPSRFEAYGIVFPEALVAGIPCIGRGYFEMPNFIEEGKTGELLHNNDPVELADKINLILSSHLYKENVLQKHQEYLEKYNWENTVSGMNDIIC